MDNGQPCYCGTCWSCDPEGNRRREFEATEKEAYRIAYDDILFDKARKSYQRFLETSHPLFSSGGGHVFTLAAAIRYEASFFKEHGRGMTFFELIKSLS